MRETEYSIRQYFVFIGMIDLVGLWLRVESFYVRSTDPWSVLGQPLVAITIITSAVLAISYLLVAATMRTLLVVRPSLLRGFIIGLMALVVAGSGASLLVRPRSSTVVWMMIELAVDVYLLVNANRLIAEQRIRS